ncbi:MAG TPA: tRNA (adenosine(37)-N6)-threonylcarbamoyltransferase complex transferase subunit TsaD, partial [Candidatus Paceibacterota bacterium]|nr:tRNA (adenosine(37)-N6)-threonylcarbamoyltransferase complex transferase subunit TsaD [Candidatus Paceibacterota bacterium]
MRILAIETSCDETAFAIVDATGSLATPRFKIKKAIVSSQIALHAPFGGVVPNLAKREHLKNLPTLFSELFPDTPAGRKLLASVDLIAVTAAPGLEPALWAGINFAKELGKRTKKPVIGTNHLEGHLYSFLLAKNLKPAELTKKTIFPAIGLIVSGGHTTLLLLRDIKARKKLGETRDDAVGEAFDKVARILALPYPGGPEIQKLAAQGNPAAIPFPRPMVHEKNYDFSYSGLKTSVLYYLRDNPNANKADIAASFQRAAVDVLLKKTMRAAEEFGARSILLSGGVAANQLLRDDLAQMSKKTGR